ncbi:MAG: hypothetical protein JNL30_12845 [Rubrivivax sp.]|nr:hypothetical protein [Rubrivivax sp.]
MAKRATSAPERRQKALRPLGAARVIPEGPAAPLLGEGLVEHPDGWYWVAPDGRQQFGPFESCSMARADRDRASEEAVDEAESEREAELDLGVSDAIHADFDSPSESDYESRPDY